ncbi:hypothetical protein [Breoghania sp.]|uniref:VpaChn25_0724 family phage protein n=1 Tax=Breoghania sp. TaxID=2065378 RepID=UPI0029C9B475|nr:hypothetical protein [Breoghania sp.]
MKNYLDWVISDGRLVILRALAEEMDNTLNETLISRVLDAFGHKWAHDRVRDQLNWLSEMGAVKLTEAGSVQIASLTRRGLDHVERRTTIEGVARPSIPEA